MRQVGQLPRIIAWCTVNKTLNVVVFVCVCVCVCVCVRKTLWMRGPRPPRGAVAPKNKQTNKINQTSTVCNLLPSAGTVAYRNATIPIISCFLHSPRGGFWSGRPANKLFSCNTYFHISFYQQVLTGDFTLSLVSPTQVTRLGTIGTASLKIKFPPKFKIQMSWKICLLLRRNTLSTTLVI